MGRVTTYFAILSTAVLALVACGGNVEEAMPVKQMPKAETMEATGDAAKVDYIVVSKESMRLRVFDTDNRLICSFGVALGRGEGDKHEVGDMCTPEGEFAVVAVEDASQWLYDDGSGAVEGFYGNCFIRLNSPFKGIGIYGTDDAAIIGTHSTEGSVRLINADLDSLRGLVREGMKVRIDAMDMRIAEARAVITDEKPT
jgi:lipoprotein-anchoring transpeptidase ErfK/SrfK